MGKPRVKRSKKDLITTGFTRDERLGGEPITAKKPVTLSDVPPVLLADSPGVEMEPPEESIEDGLSSVELPSPPPRTGEQTGSFVAQPRQPGFQRCGVGWSPFSSAEAVLSALNRAREQAEAGRGDSGGPEYVESGGLMRPNANRRFGR